MVEIGLGPCPALTSFMECIFPAGGKKRISQLFTKMLKVNPNLYQTEVFSLHQLCYLLLREVRVEPVKKINTEELESIETRDQDCFVLQVEILILKFSLQNMTRIQQVAPKTELYSKIYHRIL